MENMAHMVVIDRIDDVWESDGAAFTWYKCINCGRMLDERTMTHGYAGGNTTLTSMHIDAFRANVDAAFGSREAVARAELAAIASLKGN